MVSHRDAALKLWIVLNRAQDAVAAHAAADAARHGLSPTEFAALEALHHKGPLLIGELQKAVLKSSGGMTYVVDRLELKGLARRRPCETDRRAMYVEATAEGHALMDRIFDLHAASLEAAMRGLGLKDKLTATDLLRRLGQTAEILPPPSEEDAPRGD